MVKFATLTIRNAATNVLDEPARELRKRGIDVEIYSQDFEALEDDAGKFHEFLIKIKEADFIIVRCMGDPTVFKRYEALEPFLLNPKGFALVYCNNSELQDTYRPIFKGSDDDFQMFCDFMTFHTQSNETGVILKAYQMLGGDVEVPAPEKTPLEGIYHPEMPIGISFDEYLSTLKPGLPTVGLVFSENDVIIGNAPHIDLMIESLESKGMNTIPIFFSHLIPPVGGEKGLLVFLRKYMMDGEMSRIDLLISCISTSALVFTRREKGESIGNYANFYKDLTNVPVIQALCTYGPWYDYECDASGLKKKDLSLTVVRPELDGHIISVPVMCIPVENADSRKIIALRDRVNHITDLASNYVRLSTKDNSEKKVAILMYQPKEDLGHIGYATGLDVAESVVSILRRLNVEGYAINHVPKSGDELTRWLLDGITNDFSYLSDDDIYRNATDLITQDEYLKEYGKATQFNRESIEHKWGEPVGKVTVVGKEIVVPGKLNGNIFIGFQPLRAWSEQEDAVYHDPVLPFPHNYLGIYRWIKDDFSADAVIHVGTHGTLEWLPGKSVGLSNKCYPDLALNAIPNLYPYNIDNPGEGIQAKRRSEAVLIGHLNPTLARAELYSDLNELDVSIREYEMTHNTISINRKEVMLSRMRELVRRTSLYNDVGIPDDANTDVFETYIPLIHDYLTELKDALIRSDLHVLGRVPQGAHFVEAVYSLTRLRNGSVPSLRDSLAETMGYDLQACLKDPSELTNGIMNSVIVDQVDSRLMTLLRDFQAVKFDEKQCFDLLEERFPDMVPNLRVSTEFAIRTVVPRLLKTTEEMENCVRFLNGEYIPSGPSGPPTRGNVKVMPTGRNFYGLDPDSLPTKTSWEIGCKMADQMLKRFVEEKGSYPHEIGMVIWATDVMKTNGDDVAYILWLMGVRPVWSKEGGQVNDLEVIPLEELRRPRIDVTVRITGLFRDVFPNLVEMFNNAVDLISDLDEDDDHNYLAANLRREIVEYIANGIPEDEAHLNASIRVFGDAPGSYGAGVGIAISNGNWNDTKDLADVYANCGCFAYGHGMYGIACKDQFIKRFSKVAVTIKNVADRENDILGMDAVFEYLGGMNAFAKVYGDGNAISFIGDDSNPENTKLRTVTEECRYIFRSKVLNPKYISGLKEHGYRGAIELSNLAEYTIGWGGTTGAIEDWMYDSMVDDILMNENTREWLEKDNPYAMFEIIKRLGEAIERGLWNASEDMIIKLRQLFIDTESIVEESTDQPLLPDIVQDRIKSK